jgi:uracil-DNA glycosylase
MTREDNRDLAGIAEQIEQQIEFYREIGLGDVGGSARPAELAPGAAYEATLPLKQIVRDDPPPAEAISSGISSPPETNAAQSTQQAGLFGELSDAARPPARKRPSSLVVVETRDVSLQDVRNDIGECTRCRLHEGRRNIVFGEGSPDAKLVFVGEGPGADEDATGRPFVGRAGQLLDKIIAAIGLEREQVYIANIVKCRPPGNRTPERDEVETCEPFLFRQLALIKPRVVVALGSPAFQCLLRTREPITRARGQWRDWNGMRVMPTFHPAYLLRSPDKKREAWDDMKKVRDYLATL